MKLLVLAQVPPPHHGQSAMVQSLVRGLPEVAPGIELHHVNLLLSPSTHAIGRPDPTKLLRVLAAAFTARSMQRRHGIDTLYYVPAPGRSVPALRDITLLSLVRPRFRRLVLHWHAAGLGAWLDTPAATRVAPRLRHVLGNADLSVVLDDNLRADPEALASQRIAVVPNGVPDPVSPATPRTRLHDWWLTDDRLPTVVFLGALSRDKGVFDAIQAVRQLRARGQAVRLVIAGRASDSATQIDVEAQCLGDSAYLHYAGWLDAERKHALLSRAAALIFPSQYAHEAQPLTIIEALAHDLPVAGYAWRGVPGLLPADWPGLAAPGNVSALSRALGAVLELPRDGRLRARYEAAHTPGRFLRSFADALGPLDAAPTT